MEIKAIHRIFAALIKAVPQRKTMDEVPEALKEGVQHVLDTEYSDTNTN